MVKKIKPRTAVLFFLIAISGMFSSCSDDNSNEQIAPAQKTDTVAPPVTIIITNSVRVDLDTCPPPKQSQYVPPELKVLDSLIAQGICNFTTYSTDNGLALDGISCALIDRNGNHWFGTDGGGVSRYDGKSFVNYTTIQGLGNNVVWDIIEDRNGNLWFGTAGGGVSRYDGKVFTNFTTDQGLANNLVRSIAEDQNGNIWFGTEGGGVSLFDGKTFTNFTTEEGLVSNRIRCITADKKGNIWFGTEGGGVSCYNPSAGLGTSGKSFSSYTSNDGLANNVVLSSAVDKEGNIWFGTGGYGVSRFDGSAFTTFSTAQGLANNIVWNILEDRNGNLWFGTNGGGVSCYNPSVGPGTSRQSFTNFSTAQGLANSVVLSITEDVNGSLWFGTYGGGVSRYDGGSFVNYKATHGLVNNFVRTVMEDRSGNIWFGTSGGVSRYDGKSFSNYTMAQGLAYNSVLSIIEDRNGALWFATGGVGVSRFDGKYFTTFTAAQGLAHNFVRSILEDKNGNLWFATRGGGVSCFDGKSFTNYTTAQGLASDLVWSITEDRNGNIWFGTEGGGVSCYDGKSFTNYTTEQGLANNIVWNIKEDKSGNLWCATYGGGVSVFNGQSFQNFTIANGLPDNTITQIIIDSAQNIFLGTNIGVAMIPAFNVNSGTGQLPPVEIFNSTTGFPVKDVNVGQNAMYQDKQGVIWIATGSDKTGLVRFDRSLLHKTDRAPSVIIQNIKLNNENISWYSFSESDSAVLAQQEILTFGKILSPLERDTFLRRFSGIHFDSISKWNSLPQNLELPYEHNNVTFEFTAIEPSKPWLVNYQYMLEGYDKEWSPVLKKTNATFGNIGEGTYTFKLKAQSPSGIWSEPVSYTFTVHPPWTRTWWAYSIYVLLLIATVSLIVLWNGRRLRARADELTEEVRIATLTISEEKAKIELANVEISRQKEIVEEKHKEITDSINYALRIQQAFLPDKKEIYSSLPQCFILFKPKDIVSGDFYFFHKKKDSVVIAAVDCTGHGVPGAFMSMVGSERLTDAVQQSDDMGEILSLLNKGVKISLKQSGNDESTRDGMDLAICAIDSKNRVLKYAGANRPLWIIRKGQTEIEEIKATKVAIGGLTSDDQRFSTHEIQLQQGDTFYICTDGYADQFSKRSGKKLMTRKLKEILIGIQNKSMQEQEHYLDNFVEDWKAGTEQVDDILVIGIRM